ncbi:MAG: hypothetical protein ACREYE_12420 [Gammaproteobacteria bacterium]
MTRPTIFEKRISGGELHVLGQRFAVVERELELIKYLLMTRYGPGHQIAQRVAKLPTIVKRAKAKLAELLGYY